MKWQLLRLVCFVFGCDVRRSPSGGEFCWRCMAQIPTYEMRVWKRSLFFRLLSY